MIVKNSEFKNKPEKRDFFKFIPSTKKNPEQFKEFKDWAAWNSVYEIWCIPQLLFTPSPTRVPPSYSENSTTPSPPLKTNLKSSNPPVSIGGLTLCCNSNIPLMPHSTVLLSFNPCFCKLQRFNALLHMFF